MTNIHSPPHGKLWFPVSAPDNKKAALAVRIPPDRDNLSPWEHQTLMEIKVHRLVEDAGEEAAYLIAEFLPEAGCDDPGASPGALTAILMVSDRMGHLLGLIDWDKESERPSAEDALWVEESFREMGLWGLLEQL